MPVISVYLIVSIDCLEKTENSSRINQGLSNRLSYGSGIQNTMIRLHYSKRKVETKAEWLILALAVAIFENVLHRISPSLDSDETSRDAVITLLFLFVLLINSCSWENLSNHEYSEKLIIEEKVWKCQKC